VVGREVRDVDRPVPLAGVAALWDDATARTTAAAHRTHHRAAVPPLPASGRVIPPDCAAGRPRGSRDQDLCTTHL